MNDWIFYFSISCLFITVLAIGLHRRFIRKMLRRMEEMLQMAMNGTFHEMDFDETQLSRLESTLAHYLAARQVSTEKLADEKNKINTLISDISHQTKTPISNLLLYSELLQEEALPESAARNAVQIHNQAKKLSFLIASLVKLSRLETGIVTLNPCPHSLTTLLTGLREQYETAAEAKGLQLVVHMADAKAVFDEKWTLEAVGNIVDNAIKYTNTGSVTVSIKPYELFTCIEVRDTGIGITEKEQAAVFRRFYRSEDVRDEQGNGLGLFLARQIIAGQGGYIKIKSAPGAGTVFSVCLPAA